MNFIVSETEDILGDRAARGHCCSDRLARQSDDLYVGSMAAPSDRIVLQGERLTATVEISGGTVAPSQGLFQPPFELSEADFLRLKQKGSITSIGGALIAFALAFTLPLVAQAYLPSPGEGPVSKSRWIVAAVSLAVGFLVWGVGLFGSRDRGRLMKRIEDHFHDHPNQRMAVRKGKKQ